MTSTTTPSLVKSKSTRIESIDLLRGLVMIIMALDHVRDYFHADAFLFNPTDLTKTNVALFFTRFVTHICAPVFVFLAGTSAFIVGQRKGRRELSFFLVKRGIWLIVLEFTVVNFGWLFNAEFPLLLVIVIWTLGISMIALAGFIHLPFAGVAITGALLVFGHNLLDNVHFPGSMLWSLLHEQNVYHAGRFTIFVAYPVLPWIGLMLLGYCFGSMYRPAFGERRRKQLLLRMAAGCIALFVVMRLINGYGDPIQWSSQSNPVFTILSFFNVYKYPPSLAYVLITMGPAFLFLAFAENWKGKFASGVTSLGRVPMFYYIIHIYAIHILAMFAAMATGFSASDMTFNTWVTDSRNLKGYGFSLWTVYLVWIVLIIALLPLCKWYDHYKQRNKEKWWLSYL
ncbi:MAG: heparan-alpha-glucosaminide N-acetyltransferase domain-containing protein [Chryseolinea sp.]